ncbi:Root meristem growth factor 9 [Tripterygium wilfordii]|uniref:Root meristem growth factor 9 n=1 Tax=Tripterygium wilfordii TaxID=458696 RepID=A0A7J7DFX9_TRIWF|nr:Root meristem growth factor 9 [Tripterygium wilfordii]
MARVPCKRIVLVVFIVFAFISITARGRSLREASKEDEAVVVKGQDNQFTPKENGAESDDGDDLVGMDYTPARKKPPIHN